MPGFCVARKEDTHAMRKGLTLIEALIVTVVIAVLSALGYLGVDEYIASAEATKIIMNLHTLRKATWAWYADNREKVMPDGRVKMGTGSPQPIQNAQNSLHLDKYLKRLGASSIKFKSATKEKITIEGTNKSFERGVTDLEEGCYGVCDDGTTVTIKDNKFETEENRNIWYVGYRFKGNEGKVREKIRGRIKTAGGLWLGTADAHPVPAIRTNPEEAVWLKVR